MERRLVKLIHGILISAVGVCLFGPPELRAEEEADGRLPVVVRPKRASINARGLPRLIELAEQYSPNIQKAQADLTVARLEYSIAGKQWLPSLDLTLQNGHGVDGADLAKPSQWAQNLNLKLTENLYDNGKSLTKFQIAKSANSRAQIEFELARDQQLLNVTNAFYDWSSSTHLREILESKRDLLKRQYAVLETLYKHGIKTKRDVLRIETEVRKNEIDLINADNDTDLNFQKLSSAAGVPREELEKEEIESEEPKPFVKTESNAETLNPRNHRQAKVFEFNRREAQLNTQLQRREYLPQVFASGSFGYSNLYYMYRGNPAGWDDNHLWGWTALLTIQYNIWDFGIRREQLEIAKVREKQVTDKTEQQLLDLGNDLRNVTNQLRALRENVRMTRELLVLEQQSYSILEAEYRNGRAQYLDLILNLNSLIDARSKFNASYYGLKKQQALYSFHQGELYETLKQK